MIISLAIALVLAISGGVSFAAQDALPGDLLYPVKTHVNESVRSAIAISDEAQVKVDTALAVERTEEAKQLQAEGRLDAETSAELKADFASHVAQAKNLVTRLEADGSVSSNIVVDLDAAIAARGDLPWFEPDSLGDINNPSGGNGGVDTPPPGGGDKTNKLPIVDGRTVPPGDGERENLGTGVLQGKVTIGPSPDCAVTNWVTPCVSDMRAHEVVVYSAPGDGSTRAVTVAGRTQVASDGSYRITLPYGAYLARVEPHVGIGGTPEDDWKAVTIATRAGATLDFNLDTGIR